MLEGEQHRYQGVRAADGVAGASGSYRRVVGVTGAPGEGLSFPNLHTAVRAHTGRLLAYALPSGAGTQAQAQLIEEALAFRPLPDEFRGVAPTLGGLAGTWATDDQYAITVAGVANEIRLHSS